MTSKKTEVLIIGPNFFACNNLDPCLILYFTENSSSSVRNLGVLFDSNLSFKKHQNQNQNELYCQVYLHIYVIQLVFVTEATAVQQSDSDRTKNTNNTNKNKKEQVNKE